MELLECRYEQHVMDHLIHKKLIMQVFLKFVIFNNRNMIWITYLKLNVYQSYPENGTPESSIYGGLPKIYMCF